MSRPVYDGSAAPPVIVNIETTKFCNLRCRMCLQFLEGSTVKGPHMRLDHFRAIAADVFPFVDYWQPSVAGEPIVTKHFGEMLDTAHSYGLTMDMTTNGTLRRGAVMDRVVRDLRSVQFSFDSPVKQTFESIRIGAHFETIVANIVHLRELCEETRPDNMPRLGLSVTLMDSNIREFPDLVEFAAKTLKVHHIQAMHVFPVTEEMRQKSMAKAPDVAAACIQQAVERARQLGIGLIVYPLDNVISATSAGSGERAIAENVGHVEGLGLMEVPATRAYPARRTSAVVDVAIARQKSLLPSRGERVEAGRTDLPKSMLFCDHLWNRAYVHLDNSVLPCCMPGAPVVGYLQDQPFHELWNNPNYRVMRQRMVAGDPVDVCRGCQWVRRTDDPAVIGMVLGDAAVPEPSQFLPVPDALGLAFAKSPQKRAEPPATICWSLVHEAVGYRVEFAMDPFYGLVHVSETIAAEQQRSSYTVPEDLWRLAPAHRSVYWRVIASLADGTERRIAKGLIPPEKPIWDAKVESEPASRADLPMR